jgi:hypothetical protein
VCSVVEFPISWRIVVSFSGVICLFGHIRSSLSLLGSWARSDCLSPLRYVY